MSEMIANQRFTPIKCDICKNSLSIFPIYSSKGKGICGRCNPPHNALRCLPFELLADNQVFPCRYSDQGCLEKNFPKRLVIHEVMCIYRSMNCPYKKVYKCQWKGSFPEFVDHNFKEHTSLEENKWFFVDTRDTKQILTIFKIKYYNFEFTWQIFYKEKKVTFLLDHYYKNSDLIIPNLQLIIIDTLMPNPHCAKIKIGCKVSVIDPNIFKSEVLNCIITSDKSYFQLQPEIAYKEIMDIMKYLLQCTRCHKLQHFSSVYLMKDKKIYCKDCNDKTVKKKASSKVLTGLSKLCLYSCNYNKAGCNYQNYSRLMDQHLSWCEYIETACMFSQAKKPCYFIAPRREIEAHYQKCHNAYPSGRTISISSIELSEKYTHSDKRLMKFKKWCFNIKISIVHGTFQLHLEKLVPTGHQFKYEVNFLDRKDLSNRLILRKTIDEVNQNQHSSKVLLRDIPEFLLPSQNQKEKFDLYFNLTIYHAPCSFR